LAPFPRQRLRDTQEPLDLGSVKADDHLTVDDRDRSRPQSELLQFLQRLRIIADILRDERNTLLRKKLFLLVAGASPWLGIDNHLLRHDRLLSLTAAVGSPLRLATLLMQAGSAVNRSCRQRDRRLGRFPAPLLY